MGRRKVSVEYIEKDKKRMATYEKRKKGLLKKAYELSTLCDVPLCMLVYPPPPDSAPVTYPENQEEVGAVIHRYISGSREENAKRRLNLEQGLALLNNNNTNTNTNITPNSDFEFPPPQMPLPLPSPSPRPAWQEEKCARPTWYPQLDALNKDELLNLASFMDLKLRQVEEKIRVASPYHNANANYYNTSATAPAPANATNAFIPIPIPIPISACTAAVDFDHDLGMKMMMQWPPAWHSDQPAHFPTTWG